MRYITFAPLLAVLLVACEGPVGPAGPQGGQGTPGVTGLQGPAGLAGPGTRLWLPRTSNSVGSVYINLPAAAGSINSPPVMACYRAARKDDGTPSPQWLVIGGATSFGRCGLMMLANDINGPLTVWMDDLPANWPVGVVIVY
jgi:hypothetical protein